jgi:hypothetical protein
MPNFLPNTAERAPGLSRDAQTLTLPPPDGLRQMPFRRSLLALAFALGLDVFGRAAWAAPPPAGLEAGLDAILARGAPGVSVLVYRNGDLLYRMDRGRIAEESAAPVFFSAPASEPARAYLEGDLA